MLKAVQCFTDRCKKESTPSLNPKGLRIRTQKMHKHLKPTWSSVVVEGWWFGLVLEPQDLGTLQSLSPPWIKCKAICLTAKAWLKQWSQTQQQIYSRMSGKEKNQGVAMVQSKTILQPGWNIVLGPQQSCTYTNATNLNELKQRYREITPQQCEGLITESNNLMLVLLKVVLQAVESWGVLSFSHISSAFFHCSSEVHTSHQMIVLHFDM